MNVIFEEFLPITWEGKSGEPNYRGVVKPQGAAWHGTKAGQTTGVLWGGGADYVRSAMGGRGRLQECYGGEGQTMSGVLWGGGVDYRSAMGGGVDYVRSAMGGGVDYRSAMGGRGRLCQECYGGEG